MPGDTAAHARHFQPGTRVRIAVPRGDGDAFQEWGEVSSLRGDLLEIELSREALPVSANLRAGTTIRIGLLDRHRTGLGCNACLLDASNPHRLALRLLDDLTQYEPRQFFRQDVCLPLDYRIPASQFPQEITEHWRQCRWATEFAGQESAPDEAAEVGALRQEIRAGLRRREATPPVAINLSGGGLRLNIKERLHPGMLVELGIHLPQPRRSLEIVGEVVHVTAAADRDSFSTALRYRLIDEADRDRLVAYLAAQQLWQLSRQAPKGEIIAAAPPPVNLSPLRLALGLLVLAALFAWQTRSIMAANERGEQHVIARTFEQGILDLLRQRR